MTNVYSSGSSDTYCIYLVQIQFVITLWIMHTSDKLEFTPNKSKQKPCHWLHFYQAYKI